MDKRDVYRHPVSIVGEGAALSRGHLERLQLGLITMAAEAIAALDRPEEESEPDTEAEELYCLDCGSVILGGHACEVYEGEGGP